MRWPRSKISQTLIALVLAILDGANECGRFEMRSFHNFYFGPHKAFPYPYASAHSAYLALARNCGLAFGIVFIAALALQRSLTSRRPNRGANASNADLPTG